MGLCIVSGNQSIWTLQQRPVIYVNLERPKNSMNFRESKLRESLGIDPNDSPERMGYIRILGQLYSTGGYLETVDELRSSAKISPHLWKKFEHKITNILTLEPAGWTHPVVLETLQRSQRISEERSAAARRRWDKEGNK